tara:strand:- start:412 stop:852 length:441 start_codon:yes stop_codon:yes gene_type:complete
MSNSGNVANNATMARIAELEAMQAELKALKATVKNQVRMKVSAKGGISIYGLQRMPVTLYAGQWERIIDMCKSGDLGSFIMDNEAILTRKGEQPLARPAVEDKPAPKAKSKAKPKASKGPTDAELAAIAALNDKVSKMPASDIFEV